jgi:hypothetical protein
MILYFKKSKLVDGVLKGHVVTDSVENFNSL